MASGTLPKKRWMTWICRHCGKRWKTEIGNQDKGPKVRRGQDIQTTICDSCLDEMIEKVKTGCVAHAVDGNLKET